MNINIKDLLQIKNPIIIDLRTKEKYLINHIKNSYNVFSEELLDNYIKYLNYNNIYYVYCDYGKTSYEVASFLNSKGYKVISVNGGFYSYLEYTSML